MSSFRVGIDLEDLLPSGGALSADVFPSLAAAVARVAERGLDIWRAYASGEPLPNGKSIHSRSGTYARSIKMRMTGDFSAEDYSDLAYAKVLEEGGPPRDLKTMLSTSSKVRISKAGKRYLIIPFQHGTPGSVSLRSTMTPATHALAKALTPSHVTGRLTVPAATGAHDLRSRMPVMVTRNTYKWGGRLKADSLRAAGASGNQLRHMTGMVKMQDATKRHTSYLTFRVMTEDSTGWITRGSPAYWPAQSTAEILTPIAESAFRDAVTDDMKRYLSP